LTTNQNLLGFLQLSSADPLLFFVHLNILTLGLQHDMPSLEVLKDQITKKAIAFMVETACYLLVTFIVTNTRTKRQEHKDKS
jgi:hypothetical protein